MSLAALCKRFGDDRAGAIAVVFALSLVPMVVAVGAAIDYARASSARSDLQAAVDAAALAAGRAAIEFGRADNKPQARQVFDAVFKRNDGTVISHFDARQNPQTIIVEAAALIPLQFAGILKRDSITVNASATVPLGAMAIEIALVLDNSGSMHDPGKLPNLKKAANNLIDKLANATTVNTKASVALVPFSSQVRSAAAKQSLAWVRYDQVPANAWDGCLTDRDMPYDVNGVPPSTGQMATLYPAAPCARPNLATLVPLNREFDTLRKQINSMNPDPAAKTNTGIGLAHGLAMLTPGTILPTGATNPGPLIKKHLIFLTDGENTQSRHSEKTKEINQRTAMLCETIKQSNLNIVVHTILLMKGDAKLLKNCATDPDRNYHHVAKPEDLDGVFDEIAVEILTLRLSH